MDYEVQYLYIKKVKLWTIKKDFKIKLQVKNIDAEISKFLEEIFKLGDD